jgi:hypothetical protein
VGVTVGVPGSGVGVTVGVAEGVKMGSAGLGVAVGVVHPSKKSFPVVQANKKARDNTVKRKCFI